MSALIALAGMALALVIGGWARMYGARAVWDDRYGSGMLLVLAVFLGIFAPLRAASTVGKGSLISNERAEALAFAILLAGMYCAWRAVSRCAPTDSDPAFGSTLLLIMVPVAVQLLALHLLGMF